MAEIDLIDIVAQISSIGLWLKAIGAVVIIWIIFQAAAFYFNLKRLKEIHVIKNDMQRMEKKLDKILKRK